MPEEYVRREVFESEIRRTYEKIDNAVARMEAKVDAYTARVEGALAEMRGQIGEMRGEMQGALGDMRGAIGDMQGEIKALTAKMGNIVWTTTLSVAIMGLLLTGVTIGVTVYLSMH